MNKKDKKTDIKQQKQVKKEFVGDISYEEDEDFVVESNYKDKLKKVQKELREEKKKSQEYLTGWQKERASFVNYKANEEKNRKERLRSMKVDLIADFFPVLDSFDMAFSNKDTWEKVDTAWRTGIEYIHNQLMNILEKYDIKTINKINVKFNPEIHEPTEVIDTNDSSKDDLVFKIIQTGYKSGDFVIRPAKVKVYKFKK